MEIFNEDRCYSVYMHTSPSAKRYIGITRTDPEQRWKKGGKGYQKQQYFWSAIQKYGWGNFSHEIICDGLTKEEAENLEIQLIAQYKSNQRDFGYNIENGGSAIGKVPDTTRKKISEANKGKPSPNKGKVMPKEIRDKISQARKECWQNEDYRQNQIEKHKWQVGENHPFFGRKHSEETKNKISLAHIGLTIAEETKKKLSETNSGAGNPFYGKSHSDDAKQKISDANAGAKNGRARKIAQYDVQGNLIRAWEYVRQAANTLNINYSSIIACCSDRQKSAGGFVWKYIIEE